MKCIAAVVMMALVACSSAYVSPLVYSAPLAYHAAPLTYATTKVVAAPAITQYSSLPESKLVASHYAAPAPVLAYSAPTVYEAAPVAYHAPAPLAYTTKVVAAPVVTKVVAAPVAYTAVQEEAKYTAVNRGAVHEAPLPGHTLSQTSLNLEPAAK